MCAWQALAPMIPVQALLGGVCAVQFASSAQPAVAAGEAAKGAKGAEGAKVAQPSAWGHLLALDFWLMFIPKIVLFTYTQARRMLRAARMHRASRKKPRYSTFNDVN